MRLHANDTPFASLPEPISSDGAYHPVSFWQETVSLTPGAPLGEDVTCDVAVVGGGFTGLSTAYELKKADRSLDVVLIERTVVGHGASGRNGGFVMPLIGWDLVHVVDKLGERGARQAYSLMYDAVAHTKQTIHENAIDCDLEETGYLLLSTCPAREKRLRREHELAQRLELDHQWLEGSALDEHIRSDAFHAGLLDSHPAVVNPAKLARGLKDLVEAMGVRIYEQTPLLELSDGDPVTLRTPKAMIRADRVVLGLNGYAPSLGLMRSRIFPVHTYIALTEPLTDADLDGIGWGPRRTSLETARNFIHYFRLTADNRILFGGEDASLYYGGKLLDQHLPTFRRLEERFREYFPGLAHVQFTHRWGGVLGVTLDMFPTFGAGGERGTIFHGMGYSGHGVALANFSGKVLAPRVLGQPPSDSTAPFFFDRKPIPLLTEPFRYSALHLYRVALRAQDGWQGA
jgi:glycine/D-amino acid oxidase-like deaminating enzyme